MILICPLTHSARQMPTTHFLPAGPISYRSKRSFTYLSIIYWAVVPSTDINMPIILINKAFTIVLRLRLVLKDLFLSDFSGPYHQIKRKINWTTYNRQFVH
ncbi:hypothetical protein D3C87_1448770 [compost metagenome]